MTNTKFINFTINVWINLTLAIAKPLKPPQIWHRCCCCSSQRFLARSPHTHTQTAIIADRRALSGFDRRDRAGRSPRVQVCARGHNLLNACVRSLCALECVMFWSRKLVLVVVVGSGFFFGVIAHDASAGWFFFANYRECAAAGCWMYIGWLSEKKVATRQEEINERKKTAHPSDWTWMCRRFAVVVIVFVVVLFATATNPHEVCAW